MTGLWPVTGIEELCLSEGIFKAGVLRMLSGFLSSGFLAANALT